MICKNDNDRPKPVLQAAFGLLFYLLLNGPSARLELCRAAARQAVKAVQAEDKKQSPGHFQPECIKQTAPG